MGRRQNGWQPCASGSPQSQFRRASLVAVSRFRKFGQRDEWSVILIDTNGDQNTHGPAISGNAYTVSLPAYGYALYRIK